ncbi:TIGR04282 family arsenosugar biosynthesis glycosyltransferase [Alkalinema pantanalense CENA528]|uniref:TIGR04282 family arsenosugar biosynthesis glycosyltransferase n=1 Tax=Alkalinema pantanalense TaxID=1620705 RepID=UPI003D6F6910
MSQFNPKVNDEAMEALNLEKQRGRLVVFTKYPTAGAVKTRLIPALGAEGATKLHQRLAEYTIAQAQEFLQARKNIDVDLEIRFAGSDRQEMADWLGTEYRYVPQGAGDLGDRMARSITESFAQGYSFIVLIGTDCPAITPDLLSNTFSKLSTADVVIGPARDGGYYLIGIHQRINDSFSRLFQNIQWSTSKVLLQTLEIASRFLFKTEQLPILSDIDRPEDLQYLPKSIIQSSNSDIFH